MSQRVGWGVEVGKAVQVEEAETSRGDRGRRKRVRVLEQGACG